MARALGASIHTGWAACVVVAGTPSKPTIVANRIVEVLGDDERFCFHMAAEMKLAEAVKWLATVRKKALANAKKALAPLVAEGVTKAAIVAKPGVAGELERVLASHPRLHTAEGALYRDVFREACGVPAELVPPSSLDISGIGKLAGPPWGRDQKLAALAGWTVLGAGARGRAPK
jgi:hypothetical protein